MMTVKSETQGGVINLTPLKKSASFTISVDKVEVQPSRIYSRPLVDLSEEGEEHGTTTILLIAISCKHFQMHYM